MSRIYHIVNYLGYLAGFACVLMITVAVYKILTGNEMEYRRYLTRIRNGIVALILILTISTTKNLVLTYFPYTSEDAIGDFSSIKVTVTDGMLEKEADDKKGRWTIAIDGEYYVKTDVKKINFGTFMNSWKKDVDVFKAYDECQGVTNGALAEEKYYMYWDNYNRKKCRTSYSICNERKYT